MAMSTNNVTILYEGCSDSHQGHSMGIHLC